MVCFPSFVKGESNSIAENYGADKDITLSLIDLSKIPPLIDNINSFSKGLRHQIFDLKSAIKLSRSIDMSERYGQGAKGSTGLVDLGDLIKNVQQRYPILSEEIAAIEDTLESAIIYAHAGGARPNANGLSVYMPLTKTEFNENAEIYVVDIDWFGLLNTQKTIISSDTNPPVLKSIVSGDTISIGIYGSDISSIFAYIITNSSKGQNLMYVQNIIPSLSNDLGLFQYSNSTMASLCNENSCIPTTINIENNGDRRFAFIPVRVVSYEGDINSNISLVYEIGNDGNFEFLGGTSEIEPEGAVPKSKLNLRVNDLIYTKALPVIAPYQIVGSINSTGIRDISNYVEDGPLLVNDGTKVFPRYIPLNSSYAVSFTMCDYSDNCDKTRWYSINPPNQTSLIASSTPEPENSERTEMFNMSAMKTESFITYTNPVFGFELNYPSDWTVQTQDITDFSDYDLSADPIITQFFPSNYTGIIGSNFRPGLTISVTDWPFKESPKSLFDFIRKTYPNSKIISAGPDLVGENPAYRFIMEYVSEEENYLGIAKDSRVEMMVTTLMNGKMYTIDFSSYSSQFNSYLPVVESIIDSFGRYVYSSENDIVSSLNGSILNNSSVKGNGNGILTGPISVSTFVDELHGYSIEYPSNLGLGKPISMETLNPELMGNLFLLDNSSGSPSQEGIVYASINAFYKNESNLMQEYFRTGEIGNLDLESIIPLADEKLSVYKLSPSFTLIRNETTSVRDNIFYVIEYQYFNPAYRSMQHEKLFYMIQEDTLFIFEFGSPPSKYQQYLPVFENMVNSFQYNKNDTYARQAIH